jgi:hypothetical protein
MKKFFALLFFSLIFLGSSSQAFAIYDPLTLPNNKFGIHILFPAELPKAAELVNSSGGDWGYITIPIQAGDKDIVKWQSFFDECRSRHIIPIVRLATEGNYFDKSTWRVGRDSDILDFANFLNSLSWPTKNRYVIVFNEVNRADEWEGKADPGRYATLLSYAVTVFKSKNPSFFIISAGMDNASITDGKTYNEYDFFTQMDKAVPGIFNQIDGFASHAYPNPAFSQPPSARTSRSISSFSFEEQTLDSLSNKKLPIFITETGWDQAAVSQSTAGNYFKTAVSSVWTDPRIIAITPFLLQSGPGPFQKFSFLDQNGSPNDVFRSYQSIPKTRGTPPVNPIKKVLGVNVVYLSIPVRRFQEIAQSSRTIILKNAIKWFFPAL